MDPEALDPIVELARERLGVTYLYPYQRLVIANTLEADAERRSQIVVLPTGSGKTLCFTLPALLLDGLSVIVYPLLSLMADQERRFREAGIECAVLKGGQSRHDRDRIFAAIAGRSVRCLLASPEVLDHERIARRLREAGVAHFVIDEAHCVTEWGETFRPSYLTLGATIDRVAPAMVTAFTATASPVVLDAVTRTLFGDTRPHLIQGDPDRPNISYHRVRAESKGAALRALLEDALPLPAVVFCRSRKRVEAVARELAGVVGYERVSCYHAGLSREERTLVEEWFFSSHDGVLVATCAYGMGVDKSDIRSVIHYELPSSVEAFLQESGRAGRDREPATSVVLWNEGDTPREHDSLRAAREAAMHGYLRTTDCLRSYLMAALGAESQTCFGCDACSTAPTVERVVNALGQARRAMLAYVRENRRRLTFDEAVRTSPVSWPEHHRQELLRGLIAGGRVVVRQHIPWRWMLTTGRNTRRLT